jgi:hypothetical protein
MHTKQELHHDLNNTYATGTYDFASSSKSGGRGQPVKKSDTGNLRFCQLNNNAIWIFQIIVVPDQLHTYGVRGRYGSYLDGVGLN